MRRKQNGRLEGEGGIGKLSVKDIETEMMPSMWPVDLLHNYLKHFSMGRREADKELLEEASQHNTSYFADDDRLKDLVNLSEKGHGQLHSLARLWEHTQANALRLLTEHLNTLHQKRFEAGLKHQQILEELINEKVKDKRSVAILEDGDILTKVLGSSEEKILSKSSSQHLGKGSDSLEFWKNRARQLDHLLSESLQREDVLMKRLQETSREKVQVPLVQELQQQLLRADNFLHFILKDAPVVVAHQDKELRYRFIFNHFPILKEEDIIGKTDDEIFHGVGVQELMEFKRAVIEKKMPMKRELSFDTDLIGKMTFLIAAEPVFNKKGETIGLNYVGFDISDQVSKMEKLAKLREEIAVQKAMESELHKTIHITEETMRAKQLLATMSHEIRSPLSGVLSMAEILATTKLDSEQQQLMDIMLSSGDLVLQLINDILDLSKVQSGAMKLESTKFRPREVVTNVLQMATASLQNRKLVVEAVVSDEVPEEIVGDVLRIRQIFTNLVSNAIKFTHEGSVGIVLRATFSPTKDGKKQSVPNSLLLNCRKDQVEMPKLQSSQSRKMSGSETVKQRCSKKLEVLHADTNSFAENASSPEVTALNCTRADEGTLNPEEVDTIWLHCDVCDTGIGIPENSLPNLFNEYMQVSTTHAREYGGTGLGLAICKQLVELMGGTMTVSSKENIGSKFSFILPCKAAKKEMEVQLTEELLQKFSSGGKQMISQSEPSETTGHFLFNGRKLDCAACKPLIHTKNLSCKDGTSSTYSHSIIGDKNRHFEEDKASKDNICISDCHPYCQKVGTEQSTSKGGGLQCTGKSLSRDLHLENLALNERQKEILTTNESTTALPNGCWDGDKALKASNKEKISMGLTSEGPWMSRRPKILLAEDNSVNVMVARSMMKRLGHSLDVVGNGAEALQALQRNDYDLILMDVCMPVMDGFEATRRIRHFEETGRWEVDKGGTRDNDCTTIPSENFHSYTHNVQNTTKRVPKQRIPIIAMTANALADNVTECFAQGMDSFVAKPVTFQTLAKVINQFISGLRQDHSDNC